MAKKERNYGTTGLFPQPVDKLLSKVTAPAMRKHGSVKARVFAFWPLIVGTEMAAKCKPYRLTRETLTLAVAPGFALEIQHSTPLLLEKITRYLGHRAISSIKLVQT